MILFPIVIIMAKKKKIKKKKRIESPEPDLGTIQPRRDVGFIKEPKAPIGPPQGLSENMDYIAYNWNKKFIESQTDIEQINICEKPDAFIAIITSLSDLLSYNSRKRLLNKFDIACGNNGEMKFSEVLDQTTYEESLVASKTSYDEWRKQVKQLIEDFMRDQRKR